MQSVQKKIFYTWPTLAVNWINSNYSRASKKFRLKKENVKIQAYEYKTARTDVIWIQQA